MFGERRRVDPAYTAITGVGLETKSGWAWANHYPGYDYLFGPVRQINWVIPPGTTTDPGYTLQDDRCSVFGSYHTNGANFCFSDGSVHFLNQGVPVQTLQQLATRAGGEVVDSSQY